MKGVGCVTVRDWNYEVAGTRYILVKSFDKFMLAAPNEIEQADPYVWHSIADLIGDLDRAF